MRPTGFPHSAIRGSQAVCASPRLIAAYRGLHRLRIPRHPPHALVRLTTVFVAKQSTRIDLTLSDNRSYMLNKSHSRIGFVNPTIYHYFRCQTAKSTLRALQPARRDRREASRHKQTSMWEGDVRDCATYETFSAPVQLRGAYSRSVKEVIQPQVPLRLPCYDFAPVTRLAFGRLPPCGLRHGLRALRASMA